MQTMLRRPAAIFLAATLLILADATNAQSVGGTQAKAPPARSSKAPEQAAIDACKGKSDGDRATTFTDSAGKKRKYLCSTVDGVLAARAHVVTAVPKAPPN